MIEGDAGKSLPVLLAVAVLAGTALAQAPEQPASPPASAADSSVPSPETAPGHGTSTGTSPGTSKKKRKGQAAPNRDTEGTEALNRFQDTTVIRSQYSNEGQPLEVDPD